MFAVDGEGKRSFGKWVSIDFSIKYIFSSIRLVHKDSGRALSIESTQKGLQLYTGNYLNNVKGHGNAIYNKYSGVCLETQNFTDSVNNQVNIISKNWLIIYMIYCSLNFQVQFFVLVKNITNKQFIIFI